MDGAFDRREMRQPRNHMCQTKYDRLPSNCPITNPMSNLTFTLPPKYTLMVALTSVMSLKRYSPAQQGAPDFAAVANRCKAPVLVISKGESRKRENYSAIYTREHQAGCG